jgi:hypothetical protein
MNISNGLKKFLTVLGLLLIIILSFSYVALKLLANGSEGNFFNKNYRAKFAANPFLRQLIGLHFDGDAKSDYLGSRYKKILIEIDQMEGLDLPKPAMDLLAKNITAATGKEVVLDYSDVIPFQPNVSTADIDKLVKQYRNASFASDSAKLYLLYLPQFDDNVDHLGSTYQEYGMLLFDTALRNFTKDSPDTFNNYVESTALHEFGHQIGLQHNQQPDCIMYEYADENHVIRENPSDVVTDFCDYEKSLIEGLKSN